MPLDTGTVSPDMLASLGVDNNDAGAMAPSLETLAFAPGVNLGAGLRAAREFKGLSLQDVADATRVRSHYLGALEAMDLGQLPSRPFAIGYVRAYARVLGLDEEAAVARFKEDAPDQDQSLRAPVGVSSQRDPRLGLILVFGVVVVGAIIVWNLAQRGMAASEPPPPAPVETAVAAQPPVGAVSLGEALPAPVESTIPAPYVTPGMAAAGSPEGEVAAAPATPQMLPPAPVTNPRAVVYGAPAEQSYVSIRARKSASLIVRGADRTAHFARQLAEGDTYRLPNVAGLTVEVSDPAAFDLFVGGAFRGQLQALETPLSKLQG